MVWSGESPLQRAPDERTALRGNENGWEEQNGLDYAAKKLWQRGNARHYFRPFPCLSLVACRSHVLTVVPQAPTTLDLGIQSDDDNIQTAKATENEGIITNRDIKGILEETTGSVW